MTLPRGFKAEAERMAEALRRQIGVESHQRIDLHEVAKIAKASIVDGGSLVPRSAFEEIEALQVGAFSAATFEIAGKYVIVTNPINSQSRLHSDIAHELGHILLKHNLSEIRELDGTAFRTCEPEEEEQATALGGTILLPRPLLIRSVHAGLDTPSSIAAHFGVSEEMARFRLNSTGVLKQVENYRRTSKKSG